MTIKSWKGQQQIQKDDEKQKDNNKVKSTIEKWKWQ